MYAATKSRYLPLLSSGELSLALFVIGSSPADAQGSSGFRADPCRDLSGKWINQISGSDPRHSTWTLSHQRGNSYDAVESGLGNARGTATYDPARRTLQITWSAGRHYGYYTWQLDSQCSNGSGWVVHTDNDKSEDRSNVTRADARPTGLGDCGDLSGQWESRITGRNPRGSTWTLGNRRGNVYDAHESGLGNARGRATYDPVGNTLRIEWSAGSHTGYYEWKLGSTCRGGRGSVVHTDGDNRSPENADVTRKPAPMSGGGGSGSGGGGGFGTGSAGGSCGDLTGSWRSKITGSNPRGSTWTLSNRRGNTYDAAEAGLGNGRGLATYNPVDNTLRIEWSAGSHTGYYVWTLDSLCSRGTGRVAHTDGDNGSDPATVTRESGPGGRPTGPPAGAPGGMTSQDCISSGRTYRDRLSCLSPLPTLPDTGICADPRAISIIDSWLTQSRPWPGAWYDCWGRWVGVSENGSTRVTNNCQRPDVDNRSRCRYVLDIHGNTYSKELGRTLIQFLKDNL